MTQNENPTSFTFFPALLAVFFLVIVGMGILLLGEKLSNRQPTPTPTPRITQTPTPTLAFRDTLIKQIPLEIVEPTDNLESSRSALTIRGQTTPRAEVSVNDKETRANTQGVFTVYYTLEEGENYLLIVATDEEGNYSEKEIIVTYTPPESNF